MSNNHNEEAERREFQEFYNTLSVEDRRDRILLAPEFRDPYNQITQAHRVIQLPRYFWENWVPILGPLATTLYINLRQYVYYNPKTGEKRDWCWPVQRDLCQELGIGSRMTLRKGLEALESHGFIKREKGYRRDSQGHIKRGSDKYFVYFEIPLVDRDAVELLIRQAAAGNFNVGAISPVRPENGPTEKPPVENPPRKARIWPEAAEQNLASNVSTSSNTFKNANVVKQKTEDNRSDESVKGDVLAEDLADVLDDTNSLGFYRRVVRLMPETVVWRVLGETKEASSEGRIRTSKGRYFNYLIQRSAKEQGIDLGLSPAPAPKRLDLHLGSANE